MAVLMLLMPHESHLHWNNGGGGGGGGGGQGCRKVGTLGTCSQPI